MLFHLYLPSFSNRNHTGKGILCNLVAPGIFVDDRRRYIDNIGFKSVNHKQPPQFSYSISRKM